MKGIFKRILSTVMACVMVLALLPAGALAEENDQEDVVYGTYVDGVWIEDEGCDGVYTTSDGVTVSKIAEPTGNFNEFEITLTVETSTTTTVTNPDAAATVLVIDVSGSMARCAECGESKEHSNTCSYSDQVTSAQTRLTAAQNAAKSFLDSYKGETSGTGRYVAIVSFSSNAFTVLEWVDVSTTDGYDAAVSAIEDLEANGGTNLEQGLSAAGSQLDADEISGINSGAKNVIVLTDGVPTFYGANAYGPGSDGCPTVNEETAKTAAALNTEASVYTVCFGAADNACWTEISQNSDKHGGGKKEECATCGTYHTDPAPTVGEFLADSIATGSGYAYNADDADELYEAFEAITESITSGLTGEGVTVTDPMADSVTAELEDDSSVEALIEGGNVADGFTWNLSDAVPVTRTENSTTYYTYTLTYTVTLDPITIEGFDEEDYYPLNALTTLNIPGENPITIQFPVPGVRGELPTYDVTYAPGEHGTLTDADSGTGNVVHENVKHGTETPAAPEVQADDGYYFTGWSPEVADTVTEDVTYTAQYEEQTAVTITGESNSDTIYYDGTEHILDDISTNLPGGFTLSGLSYSASGTDAGDHAGSFTGTAVITNSSNEDVTNQFKITLITGKLIITANPITIKADDAAKTFDDTPLTKDTYTIESGSLANGQKIESVTITGSQTTAGSSPNVPSNAKIVDAAGNDVTTNYNITFKNGTLTVNTDTRASIEAKAYTGTYDGEDHKGVPSITLKNGAGIEIPQTGWTITYTCNGTETSTVPEFKDAGTYVVTVKAANPNYCDVETTVTAVISKRAVTLTSPNQNKMYDGTALTGDLEEFHQDGFVTGEGVTFKNPASITNVSESPKENTINFDWNGNTDPNNYEVDKKPGTLTIYKNDNQDKSVSLTATAYSSTYDGKSYALVTGTQVTGAVAGNSWTYTYSTDGINYKEEIPTGINAGSYDVWVKASTENYEDLVVKVTAVISPRPVTLTSEGKSWSYDGQTHKNEVVTPDGFVGSDGATYDNFAAITNVNEGPKDNTFDYTLKAGTIAANYSIKKAYGKLEITVSQNASLTVTGYTGSYDGQAHTVTCSISGDVEGTPWIYQYKTDEDGTWLNEKPACTDAGTYMVYVTAANSNYAPLEGCATVEIAKRSVTLTSATTQKSYDDTPLTNDTVTTSGEGFVEGEGVTCEVTGSQTEVGESANTFTYRLKDNTKAENYEIQKNEGTLKVTPYEGELSLVAAPYTQMYDGDAHNALTSYSVSGNDVQGTVWSYTFSTDGVNYSVDMPTCTDVGEYPVYVKAANPNYNDVVMTEPATAEITARTVILTSGDAYKTYDRNALTNCTVSVTGDGFAAGEGATYDVTGSQTNVGKSENFFTYKLWDGTGEGQKLTKADNYKIEKKFGELTVGKNDGTSVRLTAAGYEGTYDGQSHDGVTGTTVTGAAAGSDWTCQYRTSESGAWSDENPKFTDAGSYTVYVKASNDNYEDLITTAAVTITVRNVTLTSASDSKVYDGTALTNAEVTVGGDGFVTGEGATFAVTGSQTRIGSSKNAFTYALKDGTKTSNYNITKVEGTLKVIGADTITVIKTPKQTNVTLGDTITWTVTVKNSGNAEVRGLTLTDSIEGVTITAPDGVDPANFSVPANSEVVFTVTCKPSKAGSYINHVEVSQPKDDPDGEDAPEKIAEDDSEKVDVDDPYYPPVEIPDPTIKVKGLNTVDHVAYIIGVGNNEVNPLGTITRAEIANIYFRLMTDEFRSANWSTDNRFKDVPDDAWYTMAILTLDEAGVITDSDGGSFRPDDPITRAELAVMAAQFCTVTGNIPKTTFKDVPNNHWAAKEIALIEYAGWIEGYAGYFRPDDDLTRAEAVTIVNRMLQRGAEVENMLRGMVTFVDNNPTAWYYEAIQEAANSHDYTRTAKLLTGEDFRGEKWTALLEATDWAALEKAWIEAKRR